MRTRLLLTLSALVLFPLLGAGWLAARVLGGERSVLQESLEALLLSRLGAHADAVGQLLEERQRNLDELLASESLDDLRRRTQSSPYVTQMFRQDAAGELVYPSPRSPSLSTAERDFLARTRQLWLKRDALVRPNEGAAGAGGGGWYVGYWEGGLDLLYWRRAQDGGVVGAELNGARLLADVITALPNGGDDGAHERLRLVDARGQVLHQWGAYSPAGGEAPRAERQLEAPLAAWRLQAFLSPQRFEAALARSAGLGLGIGMVALTLALMGLGVYVYRESGREAREARQRLSFVNRVSHELRTPLTNIRMYSELLAQQLPDDDTQAAAHLEVVTSESQRLSRLISNVLSFARSERGETKLRLGSAAPDDVIREVVQQFAPALQRRGIAVQLRLDCPQPARLDADALAQVVGNLLSNVEKYAAGGGRVDLESRRDGEVCSVAVRDHGPGIAPADLERVFAPFVRLHDGVAAAATGTGIGLTIARELARLHGGELRAVPAAPGVRFELSLRAPLVEG